MIASDIERRWFNALVSLRQFAAFQSEGWRRTARAIDVVGPRVSAGALWPEQGQRDGRDPERAPEDERRGRRRSQPVARRQRVVGAALKGGARAGLALMEGRMLLRVMKGGTRPRRERDPRDNEERRPSAPDAKGPFGNYFPTLRGLIV